MNIDCGIIQDIIDSIGSGGDYIATDMGDGNIVVKRGSDSAILIGNITISMEGDEPKADHWTLGGFFIMMNGCIATVDGLEGAVAINLAEPDSIDKLKNCIQHNIENIKNFEKEIQET